MTKLRVRVYFVDYYRDDSTMGWMSPPWVHSAPSKEDHEIILNLLMATLMEFMPKEYIVAKLIRLDQI